MKILYLPVAMLAVLALQSNLTTALSEEKKILPCTARSSKTGSFYDLTSLSLSLSGDRDKPAKGARTESWRSTGYDYGSNFTLNFCAPVLEKVGNVVGIKESLWQNVSAYYEQAGKIYSIGQQSSNLTFRGRKLVLQYTNGSPCGQSVLKRQATLKSRASRAKDTDDTHRRKSTIISFHCEKDPLATQATTSFVGVDPDECAYFFEVRSQAACAGSEPQQQGVGPAGVFGIIMMIAVLVYFIGGVMYQRSVAHARGWRQLPNYSFWSGIGGFFSDMIIIATSSCAQLVPRRRGYISVSANGNGSSRGRSGRPDDENRLIDQLDEEWDD